MEESDKNKERIAEIEKELANLEEKKDNLNLNLRWKKRYLIKLLKLKQR